MVKMLRLQQNYSGLCERRVHETRQKSLIDPPLPKFSLTIIVPELTQEEPKHRTGTDNDTIGTENPEIPVKRAQVHARTPQLPPS